MYTARRRKISPKQKKRPFARFLLMALAVCLVAIFFIRESKFWNDKDKLSLVINTDSKDIEVVTFNPEGEEITAIFIPGNTQVEVAGNLGVWKLSAISELGRSQKPGGTLLPMTVAKNFGFPVYAWADSSALGFVRGGAGDLFRAVFIPYSTNLGLGDKIRLGLFSLGVKNINRTTIDLSRTNILKKSGLKDGSTGYTIFGSTPADIAAIFADKSASENLKTQIIDGTGTVRVAENIGRIIEVLGPKVTVVQKGEVKGGPCQVWGKFTDLNAKVARIFGCKITSGGDENFDLTIELPHAFGERF